jgi:ABC-2 type transport system permease protein
MNSARAVYIIWYRDVIRYWRDRTRFVASFAQPVLYLLIFGTGLASSFRSAGGSGLGFDYLQFIYPGVIALTVLFTAIFASVSIVWDREFGFLKEVLVAPVGRWAVAVGKVLGGATQATFQGVIMLILAPLAGVHLGPLAVIEMIPLIFTLAFAVCAMGVAIASRIKSMQAFQVVMNFITLPIFFLSGALFPLTNLPGWLTVLTRLDPAAYGVDPLRRVVLTSSGVPAAVIDRLSLTLSNRPVPPVAEEGLLLAFGAVLLGVAILNFQRSE